jgi:hypothetical protein
MALLQPTTNHQHRTSPGEKRRAEGESHQRGSHWLPVSHHIRRVAPRHCSRHQRSYVNNQTIFRRRAEGGDAYELGFCLPSFLASPPFLSYSSPTRPLRHHWAINQEPIWLTVVGTTDGRMGGRAEMERPSVGVLEGWIVVVSPSD